MSSLAKSKLLIVDDRAENILALNSILRDDYELIECSSGLEALKQIRRHDFAAILLDVQMPEMNGFETAHYIRQEKRSENTPIIFVTAIHRTEEYESQGYVAGAVDYLFKPINTDILHAKLKVFAQLHRQAELLRQQSVREKENEVLKELLKGRDQFLSMASHELKTPITPLTLQMQAFIEMLKNGTFESAPREKLLNMLNNSYGQVERLSRTVDELLDVSRFVTGQFELKLDHCNLLDMVEKVVRQYSEQLSLAKTSVTIDAKEIVEGYWDCFRIEQVIINLLTNAMKYGAGKPIGISIALDNEHATFSIRDCGIGIANEDQERIFERFERAASPRHYGGLGLGLYIASEIVRLHSGSIRVDSTVGSGSTFTVRLPIQQL